MVRVKSKYSHGDEEMCVRWCEPGGE